MFEKTENFAMDKSTKKIPKNSLNLEKFLFFSTTTVAKIWLWLKRGWGTNRSYREGKKKSGNVFQIIARFFSK